MANAADPRQVRKARQQERFQHEAELKDLAVVLSTRAGRRVIWRQLTDAGVFRLSFVPGEHERTEFNEGRRSMGLALMADIHELDPALYMTMATEAADDEKKQQPEPAKDKTQEEEESDNA